MYMYMVHADFMSTVFMTTSDKTLSDWYMYIVHADFMSVHVYGINDHIR